MKATPQQVQQVASFLFTLINAQLEKCLSLSQRGVGPDASRIATIVQQEVEDLMSHARTLVESIKDDCTVEQLSALMQVIKFYLEQEKLRSDAGHILADVPIHRQVKERVASQQEKLASLLVLLNVQELADLELSPGQMQCRLWSAQVALYILEMAQATEEEAEEKYQLDPKAMGLFKASQKPGGRYEQLRDEIEVLIKACHVILPSEPDRVRCQADVLSFEDATRFTAQMRAQLDEYQQEVDQFERSQGLHLH